MTNEKELLNVTINDNGTCYMVSVNGLAVKGFNTLGDAWRHLEWMYRIASQRFTVGKSKTPIIEWLKAMNANGYLDCPWVENID